MTSKKFKIAFVRNKDLVSLAETYIVIIASYCRQLSVDIKIKNIRVKLVLILRFYYNFRGKLSVSFSSIAKNRFKEPDIIRLRSNTGKNRISATLKFSYKNHILVLSLLS